MKTCREASHLFLQTKMYINHSRRLETSF